MIHKHLFTTFLVVVLALLPAAAQEDAPVITPREQLLREAESLRPLVKSNLAGQLLDAVKHLPAIQTRTIYHNRDRTAVVSDSRAGAIDPEMLASYDKLVADERHYYYTKYGTPLASIRAFDLAAQAGFTAADGKNVLDFGYGTIGQLRLLASLGANVTGVEVDPVLRELYSYDGDTGAVPRADADENASTGAIKLVDGHWPAAPSAVEAVGTGYDLFISKNTLKRGYIHPERDVDPRRLVHLGVDDETFVNTLFNSLNAGGFAIIYNISPAPSKPEEPYKPWADGRCPFARELLDDAGFEVIKYDEDDTAFVTEMAKALGWAESMDIENDLFAHYTLMRKPVK